MIWTVEWMPVCSGDVQRMHWRRAGRICAAIYRFAETGRGILEKTDHGHRLHVPGAVALINLDPSTCTLTVQRIFAAR